MHFILIFKIIFQIEYTGVLKNSFNSGIHKLHLVLKKIKVLAY